MNSKDFIIKSINEIVSSFPYLNFRYEFDSFSKSHFIEVRPNSSYKNDLTYIEIEKEITLRFFDLFPYESLTFISEDSYYKIEKPTYEKGFITDNLSMSFNNLNSGFEIFEKYLACMPTTVEVKAGKSIFSKFEFNTKVTSNKNDSFDIENLIVKNESENKKAINLVGELNFGLAA